MNDTIAAISTGMTTAGIGIVRISGPQAVDIADRVYQGHHGTLGSQKTHTIHYGYVMDGEETIDQVLVMLMRAPHTFTGEDVVEINCHGGTFVVKKVLESVLQAGARLATAGEFSKRAFLNGKMDLSQAEAVADVIDSDNNYALQASIGQLKGIEKTIINNIRNKIIYNTAFIESALDDPEHISLEGYSLTLSEELKQISEEIRGLLSTVDNGRLIKEGIRTVILGKPNAGKSSLMNVLVGSNKAIVTEVAGTTRDVLEETIHLDQVTLRIVDTAGIRQTEDRVEKLGVDRAMTSAKEADLILYVADSSCPLDENDRSILPLLQNKKVLILLNKSDLKTETGEEQIRTFFAGFPAEKDTNEDKNARDLSKQILSISAKEQTGIQQLSQTIQQMFFAGQVSYNNQVCITSLRHKEALSHALAAIGRVQESLQTGMPEDFYTIDLMEAYEQLSSITGERIGEDLVNEIFSKFCMGK